MPRRRRVAVLVMDQVAVFELAVACEVFGIDRSELTPAWYRFKVCAAAPGPIRSAAGFRIDTPYGLADLRRADTIVVPAGRSARRPSPEVINALRFAHAGGARILSVCTGAFTLAAAGLLDGRRATTHWMHTDELARRYPEIKIDPDVLYVDDGDILTSAGTAAGIDLCLHVVRQDFGADIANAVARRMVVPPHRDGGQAQYVDEPVPQRVGETPFSETLVYMETHLDRNISVDELAAHAAMSPRTFARKFQATTGTTPHQWRQRQRVMLAQRLLETTDESVERIAERCGFGSAAALRPHFQRIVKTSPLAYRRCFRTDD